MTDDRFTLSPSGVQIATDFRDNLIIDRYDPVFADMRASKIKHLRSANSEDAMTWNVFRSLRQISPDTWMPLLWRHAFQETDCPNDTNLAVKLWPSIPPPLGLLSGGDEGLSEIDVVLESPTWVWFIEAKYKSDISTGTTTRPERDQILRNIDVGSYYAGVRRFYFTLLLSEKYRKPLGPEAVARYKDISVPRSVLAAHRPDGLHNVTAIGLLSWEELASVLSDSASVALRPDERAYAERAVSWLKSREVVASRTIPSA